jgi:hypothetical protein
MPKIHVTKRYYRVRIKEPKGYLRYRVVKLGKGIKAVVGIRPTRGKRGGRTEVQSYLIPKHLDGLRARRYARRLRKTRARPSYGGLW